MRSDQDNNPESNEMNTDLRYTMVVAPWARPTFILSGDGGSELDNFPAFGWEMSNAAAGQPGRVRTKPTDVLGIRLGFVVGGGIVEPIEPNSTGDGDEQTCEGADTETQRADDKFDRARQRHRGQHDHQQRDQMNPPINWLAWFPHRSVDLSVLDEALRLFEVLIQVRHERRAARAHSGRIARV